MSNVRITAFLFIFIAFINSIPIEAFSKTVVTVLEGEVSAMDYPEWLYTYPLGTRQ